MKFHLESKRLQRSMRKCRRHRCLEQVLNWLRPKCLTLVHDIFFHTYCKVARLLSVCLDEVSLEFCLLSTSRTSSLGKNTLIRLRDPLSRTFLTLCVYFFGLNLEEMPSRPQFTSMRVACSADPSARRLLTGSFGVV